MESIQWSVPRQIDCEEAQARALPIGLADPAVCKEKEKHASSVHIRGVWSMDQNVTVLIGSWDGLLGAMGL